jgi:membrane protein DedA with SNARE-associated domain
VESVLAWLTGLPPAALYVTLALVAATENFVPPIPADIIVAFGSFLAARRNESPIAAVVSVVVGNVAGALAMFALGRRYGADWIRRRMRVFGDDAERRVRDWYNRFGLPALFLSRFLPAVRAVVPPVAGAIRVPATGAILAIATASTIWYTTVALLSYRVGTQWEQIASAIGRVQRVAAIAAGALVVLGVVVWWIVKLKRKAREA